LVLCTSCDAGFDRVSEVKTLRVLAVQKDKPYTYPGDTVSLSMLFHDGAAAFGDGGPRALVPFWYAGCVNPPGDLFYGCFDQLASQNPQNVSVGVGNRFSLQLPSDIISSRPPPRNPRQPPYGLAYVFFAVCAGNLSVERSENPLDIPLRCRDASGKVLGSDDFVAGYSAVYAFDQLENRNPAVTGFEVSGQQVTPDCIGDACVDTITPEPDCSNPLLCLPCASSGSCLKISVRPTIDRASIEPDPVASLESGTLLEEQMWVAYFVDRGSVSSEVRLLNDATRGYSDKFGVDFQPPSEVGPARVWAVVHDNRGGVNWARLTFSVR
jgi:hypothetical protein